MKRRATGDCKHLPPHVNAAGSVAMDWGDHRVNDKPRRCRICGGQTFLIDCAGAACHKVCAEAEHARDIAIAVREHARR